MTPPPKVDMWGMPIGNDAAEDAPPPLGMDDDDDDEIAFGSKQHSAGSTLSGATGGAPARCVGGIHARPR